ncbi:DUF485 domain-containing protein [Roseburia sp. 1XD42-34]|nr:DUF485 domain-containing protein [Roseburia sp. 1XD42-34]RKI79512.1 DUF485 domain-containing protein [Clostridium sp. 1xD42-85]
MLYTQYEMLIKRKKRFLLQMLVFLLAFYFMLPLSLALFPDFMNSTSILFEFTWGWLYAFLQIPMTWVLGWLYCRKAKQFDRYKNKLKQEAVS